MKTIAAIALAAIVLTSPAIAQSKPKLTVAQALSLLAALRNLDGHMSVVKQNGQDVTIMVPWEFGSGILRARVAGDISILVPIEKTTEETRQGIIREIVATMPPGKDGKQLLGVVPGTPQFDDFQRQYQSALDAEAPINGVLARIKMSDLKLDKNEIPVTALSALTPILDDDLAPK